jgi:hypothetical protein
MSLDFYVNVDSYFVHAIETCPKYEGHLTGSIAGAVSRCRVFLAESSTSAPLLQLLVMHDRSS